jgi:hypothetical protein
MPTTANAPAITVGVTVPALSVPVHIYLDAITINMTVSPAYTPPTPTPVPAGTLFNAILRNTDVMPTPTIVNGRPV